MNIRVVWGDEINACGDTGAAGDSVGGGAGVKSRARMREKNVVWGVGRGGAFIVLEDEEVFQGFG